MSSIEQGGIDAGREVGRNECWALRLPFTNHKRRAVKIDGLSTSLTFTSAETHGASEGARLPSPITKQS